MTKHFIFSIFSLFLLTGVLTTLGGCGCGFDCNNGDDDEEPSEERALLTLSVSDALPEDLKEVVITIDQITLQRSDTVQVTIGEFTSDDGNSATSTRFDLLEFRGTRAKELVTDFEMEPGFYESIFIAIVDDDENTANVLEQDDTVKPLTITGDTLVVSGRQINSGAQSFTIEFDLARSLRQLADGSYLLTSEGIRLEDDDNVGSLSGTVPTELFDLVEPCIEKEFPLRGNRLYLYRRENLDTSLLADVFTTASTAEIPAGAITPFAVASLQESTIRPSWEYAFGFLPPDNYLMAFSCDAEDDDPVEFDGLTIPLPENQVYSFTIGNDVAVTCDLTTTGDCQ